MYLIIESTFPLKWRLLQRSFVAFDKYNLSFICPVPKLIELCCRGNRDGSRTFVVLTYE